MGHDHSHHHPFPHPADRGHHHRSHHHPGPNFPVPNFPVPNFPVPNFPVPNFPVPNFPVPDFPVPHLPVPCLPAPHIPDPYLPFPQRGYPGHGRGRMQHRHQWRCQDRQLQQQAAELQRANEELAAKLKELSERINNNDSGNELHNVDQVSALISLANEIQPLPMSCRIFGFCGVTSSGKSTIINKGEDVAAIGAGETTIRIQSYEGRDYTLCDVPGLNDKMSYFSREYISFWKGLTGRMVVITTTVKEMVRVLRLFDGINLAYDIIVNKLDDVEVEQHDLFKETIRKEVTVLGLKSAKHIWFVSAKNPDQFPDWLAMVHHLTTIN